MDAALFHEARERTLQELAGKQQRDELPPNKKKK
jgi:hypothetical protein